MTEKRESELSFDQEKPHENNESMEKKEVVEVLFDLIDQIKAANQEIEQNALIEVSAMGSIIGNADSRENRKLYAFGDEVIPQLKSKIDTLLELSNLLIYKSADHLQHSEVDEFKKLFLEKISELNDLRANLESFLDQTYEDITYLRQRKAEALDEYSPGAFLETDDPMIITEQKMRDLQSSCESMFSHSRRLEEQVLEQINKPETKQ